MKYIKILAIVLIFAANAKARWAHYEEAPAEAEFMKMTTVIEKSGKFTETFEKQLKILNETGRAGFAVERFQYNENIEKLEILEAKTIIEGKEYKVDKRSIEIKPLASQTSGFDQQMQILISYPRVEIGAQLYLKMKYTQFKPAIAGHFGTRLSYADGFAYKKLNAVFKSQMPLHVMVNDPHQRLTVKETKSGASHTVEIASLKPAYDALISEPKGNMIVNEQKTWVVFSSFARFEDLGKSLALDYENVLSKELPGVQEFIKIAAQAKSKSVDQINTITSLLAEKVHYMGDWRTVDGKFRPRDLAKVAQSGLGDCKDFSASTAAILRSLGYEAHVALIMRGTAYLAPVKTLPTMGAFNHAIVKATNKEGEVFWIDPTNFSSMAGGIYPDIADRPVLVLAAGKPSLERVPGIDAKHATRTLVETLKVKEGMTLRTEGLMTFSGENAEMFAGASLRTSAKSIGEMILKDLSGERALPYQHINVPNLESRIVNDVAISYVFEKNDALLLTNKGRAVLLQSSWPSDYLRVSEDQEGTTFVGLPVTIKKTTIVEGLQHHDGKELVYEVKTPWVCAKRTVKAVPAGLEITEDMTLLRSWITAEDARSKEFGQLKSTLKNFSTQVALVVSPTAA